MNNANVLTSFNCFVLKVMHSRKHLNFSNIKITDEEVRAGAKHLFFLTFYRRTVQQHFIAVHQVVKKGRLLSFTLFRCRVQPLSLLFLFLLVRSLSTTLEQAFIL